MGNTTNQPEKASYRGSSSYVAPSNTSSIYKSLFSGAVSSSLSTSETASNWSYTTRTAKPSSRSTTAHSTYSTTSPIGGHNAPTGLSELPTPSPSAGSGSAGGGNDDSSGPTLSPQQKQVIGGVLGSVAGVAVLGLLLMLFLRYKKRKGSQDLLSGQTAAVSRSLGNNAPDRGPGNSDMAERSAPSAAIASALATLTGRKSLSSSQPAPGGERGFYRVSGRKLPSILVNGGDGYTDPRESAASGTSDYFRGSQAFEPTSWGSGQLALGAPMRPVSGVPVMRSGPARTPVTENNPFDDPDSPTTPTNASSRAMAPRDSPTAGGSRFQEGI